MLIIDSFNPKTKSFHFNCFSYLRWKKLFAQNTLHTENFFPNLIKLNRNQIVLTMHQLIWNSKRTLSVFCSKSIEGNGISIWFQFDLIRFQKDFSACRTGRRGGRGGGGGGTFFWMLWTFQLTKTPNKSLKLDNFVWRKKDYITLITQLFCYLIFIKLYSGRTISLWNKLESSIKLITKKSINL